MKTNATSKQQQEISRGLEMVIVTRVREIVDNFKVRRALPSAKRRMVGPFIFLDQMGPELLRANRGLDVAPARARYSEISWRPLHQLLRTMGGRGARTIILSPPNNLNLSTQESTT